MINNYLPRFFYWCWDSNPCPLRSQLSMEVRLPWIRPLACRMVAVSVRCLGSPGWCPAQEGRSARHDRSQQLGEVRIYFNTTITYVTCINLSLKAKPANKILKNLSYFKYYCLFYILHACFDKKDLLTEIVKKILHNNKREKRENFARKKKVGKRKI